jgi:hypothetical protein
MTPSEWEQITESLAPLVFHILKNNSAWALTDISFFLSIAVTGSSNNDLDYGEYLKPELFPNNRKLIDKFVERHRQERARRASVVEAALALHARCQELLNTDPVLVTAGVDVQRDRLEIEVQEHRQ